MSQPVFTARSTEAAPILATEEAAPSPRSFGQSDYFRRADPALPHRADRQRSIAFGKTAAGRVGQQLVMTVAWRR
jgi:hypothetical protein